VPPIRQYHLRFSCWCRAGRCCSLQQLGRVGPAFANNGGLCETMRARDIARASTARQVKSLELVRNNLPSLAHRQQLNVGLQDASVLVVIARKRPVWSTFWRDVPNPRPAARGWRQTILGHALRGSQQCSFERRTVLFAGLVLTVIQKSL
jgi:hypothetical protein